MKKIEKNCRYPAHHPFVPVTIPKLHFVHFSPPKLSLKEPVFIATDVNNTYLPVGSCGTETFMLYRRFRIQTTEDRLTFSFKKEVL